MKDNKLFNEVNAYYTDKILKYGLTPQGVDWNSVESQNLRFEILSADKDNYSSFSVVDYGCGYGSMFDFYKKRYNDFTFYGYDISEEMFNNAKWYTELNNVPDADFVIASGVFNFRLKNSEKEWLEYLIETRNVIN